MSGTVEWEPGDALLLVRVVEDGSFTAAARSLELPKSTVSRRVARLEAQLGLQLLRRTTRSLDLTEAGRAFYAQAALAVEALVEAGQAAASVLSEPHGRLRVSAPAELGTRNFSALLEFARAYPGIELDLDLTNRFVDLIEEGVHAALRGGAAPAGALDGCLLNQEQAILVASPSYLRAHGRPRRASELSKHDCVLFPGWVHDSAWRLESARGPTEVPVRARLRVNNLEAVQSAALDGVGVALLPASNCTDALREGTLQRLLPSLHMPMGGLWLVYPRTRFLSAKLRAFAQFMQDAFA